MIRKHKMYMAIAETVANFGTCDRARVGSVIVKNDAIIGCGFNGSPRGDLHCDDVGHLMINGHCARTVHSELNAIINAARNSVGTIGATLYCTHLPCFRCCQHIINSGIMAVFYSVDYGKEDKNRDELIKRTGFSIKKVH